ncbi:MAG: hypothetical protein ACKV2V_18100, partial [Blastocatellia bacterium]
MAGGGNFIAIFLAVLLCVTTARPQTAGVSGEARDQHGAVISGAGATLTDATNIRQENAGRENKPGMVL